MSISLLYMKVISSKQFVLSDNHVPYGTVSESGDATVTLCGPLIP